MLSIIIPTHNEEQSIGQLIKFLKTNVGTNEPIEIIVADGGSTDQTQKEVKKYDIKFLPTPQKGRSVQMNYAVSQAKGEIIYFVHADTKPPKNYARLILNKIAQGNEAGCFTSVFDWNHPFLRFCNFFSRLPFWFCRGGGQTLYVKRELFEKLNGFDEEMILMEEYDFISRVRKKTDFGIIKKNAITSARDYRKNGAFRLQFLYSYVFIMYATGCSQQKMLSFVQKHVRKA